MPRTSPDCGDTLRVVRRSSHHRSGSTTMVPGRSSRARYSARLMLIRYGRCNRPSERFNNRMVWMARFAQMSSFPRIQSRVRRAKPRPEGRVATRAIRATHPAWDTLKGGGARESSVLRRKSLGPRLRGDDDHSRALTHLQRSRGRHHEHGDDDRQADQRARDELDRSRRARSSASGHRLPSATATAAGASQPPPNARINATVETARAPLIWVSRRCTDNRLRCASMTSR